jgi:hypothetical protein
MRKAPGEIRLQEPPSAENGPARIRYGNDRPVRRAVALLNNFDFSCGDPVTRGGG